MSKEEIHSYGILVPKKEKKSLYEVKSFLEKPQPQDTDSRHAAIGMYVLTPDIFTYLEKSRNTKES
jgi:UTP--glucose-1-phosphate uridylyltransferase